MKLTRLLMHEADDSARVARTSRVSSRVHDFITEGSAEPMFESLNRVDWWLLHQQKSVLVNLASNAHLQPPQVEALWGIVHLLDALQDDAAAAGRWTFPGECGPKGGA